VNEKKLVTHLNHLGISPWENEVVYGLFNERFEIKQSEITENDPEFVSVLNISIPLPFNNEFFKWFEFPRWEKVKFILKEMKRRRGDGNAIKIDIRFSGNPIIRFIVDSKNRDRFNNAIEKIDFVLELIPYHLVPEKLPKNVTEVVYKFDADNSRWRINVALVENKKFIFTNNGWKLFT